MHERCPRVLSASSRTSAAAAAVSLPHSTPAMPLDAVRSEIAGWCVRGVGVAARISHYPHLHIRWLALPTDKPTDVANDVVVTGAWYGRPFD